MPGVRKNKLMLAILDFSHGLLLLVTASPRMAGPGHFFSIFMTKVTSLHAQLSLFLFVNT